MIRLATLVLIGLCALPHAHAQPADLALADAVTAEPTLGALQQASADDPPWTWSPSPRWLGGVAFGYPSFEGGMDYGYRYFLGSSVGPADVFPVDIVFDKTMVTSARVFRRDLNYADGGTGLFQGAAYDMRDPQNPRRLNVGFVENSTSTKPADGRWNPDNSNVGGREYLLIFASSYDGNGSTYALQNAFGLDLVIGLSPRIVTGGAMFQSNPATLSIDVPALRAVTATPSGNGSLAIRWAAAAYSGGTTVRIIGNTGGGDTELATVAASTGMTQIDGLDASATYALRIDLLDAGGSVVSSETTEVRPVISSGIEAASSLNPNRSGGNSYGDVWGYTATDGTEYALLAGRGGGLSIIDITAAPAAAPVEVGFVPTEDGASDSKDVKVYDHYAYLVNERGPIQIIDIEDPANPTQVGTLDTQPGISQGGAHNVAVFNGYLWVTGGRQSGNAGVRVYDVRTTPESPAFVGEFKPNHLTSPYYHDFEVKGTYGYGPGIYNDGIDILDVSDPSNITLVGTFEYPGSSIGPHNTCASEDGNTLYVGDEIGSAGNWTRIFDIADPQNVELVGSIVIDDQAVVHNCYTKDNLLYIAHYTEGLRVFNVQNPQDPVEVAFYDTYLQPGYGFSGAWSVYPYFDSGKLIVSDMQSGLFVIAPEAAAVADDASPEATDAALTVAPNPSRSQTALSIQLEEPAPVRLSVFDVRGRELRVLLDEPVGTDRQRVDLDTSRLAPGVYVVRLVVDGQAPISQMLTVVR
ncbi:MAG: choice-of-anchor B family protein [Bacteroidota bacterium]